MATSDGVVWGPSMTGKPLDMSTVCLPHMAAMEALLQVPDLRQNSSHSHKEPTKECMEESYWKHSHISVQILGTRGKEKDKMKMHGEII